MFIDVVLIPASIPLNVVILKGHMVGEAVPFLYSDRNTATTLLDTKHCEELRYLVRITVLQGRDKIIFRLSIFIILSK